MCDNVRVVRPPGELVTFFLITFYRIRMGFFSFHRYRYGTMARRRRRSWLAKRAEPENHVPTTRKRRRRRRSWLAKRADTSYIIYRYRYIPVYTLLLRLYDCTHRFGIPLLTAADFLFFLFFDPRIPGITPAGPQTKFRPPF